MSNVRRMRSAASASVLGFLFALIVSIGATRWYPEGRGGVDHMVVPAVLFPIVWVAFALALYTAPWRRAVWLSIVGLTVLHAALIAQGFLA